MGWEEFRDVESLRALTQLHFMTKNSKEAIPLYYYLKDLGEPLDGELGSHLRDYQFPRDFDAIEELGEKGLDHYLSQSYKKDLFEAIAQGLKTFEIGTPATAEYELRGLRLASIEFRNYSATQQFVTCVMGLYEGGWEKRAILRDFFEKNPMPRVQVFLKSENDEEIESSESTDDESDVSEDFKDILSAHLYLAARFALTPDRADLIQVLKDFATEHELDSLKSLMGDLSLVHTRISSIFHLL